MPLLCEERIGGFIGSKISEALLPVDLVKLIDKMSSCSTGKGGKRADVPAAFSDSACGLLKKQLR
jgi:hypothetical protein